MASAETQVHVLVGCSDARDVGKIHLDTVEEVRSEYLARGIRSELYVLRTPGSFVTGDVVADLASIVAMTQRDVGTARGVSYFVHVQSHAELVVTGDETYGCALHHVEVEKDSPFNCGMLAATRVAVELERLVLSLAPVVDVGEGKLRVDSEEAIRTLLRQRYGFDGYLAGDWIKSVDDVRTHVRMQKAILERAIRNDPALRSYDIRVTAGIQDYRRNAYVRLDGGEPAALFWDEGQRRINRRLAELPRESLDRARQSEGQKPLVALLAMSDVRASRARALVHYAKANGHPPSDYSPNTVFAMSGSAFDIPGSPFGPYITAGIFYGLWGLGLREILVMGNDAAQAERMVRKVHGDPLANLVVKHFGAKLSPVVATT